MAKHIAIETKDITYIALYDAADFEESKTKALATIDQVINYLYTARDEVAKFEPEDVMDNDPKLGYFSNGLSRHNILEKIKDELYTRGDENERDYGLVVKVNTMLDSVRHIAYNIYYQKEYPDEIETRYWLFRE